MTDYIQPELMILIPVLYLIGMGLKEANTISDRFIPVILGVIGIVLTACYELTTGQFNLFAAVTQGILCAGASTYANQIYKQLMTK